MLSKEALERLGLPENPVGCKLKICVQGLSNEVPELCITGIITKKNVGGGFVELSVETEKNDEAKIRASRLLRPLNEGLEDLRKGWMVFLCGIGLGETARMARVEAA